MPKKVLIVDDYADTRSFMKFLIESYGYQTLEAADGQEAVESARQDSPDLILMDLAMPVMDGLAATRVIRGFSGMTKLPIIAVTAHGQSYYRLALEAGCDDLINKPLDFATLEPVLNQYLGH
jgi:two-component system, cell cycle response regulator DivK